MSHRSSLSALSPCPQVSQTSPGCINPVRHSDGMSRVPYRSVGLIQTCSLPALFAVFVGFGLTLTALLLKQVVGQQILLVVSLDLSRTLGRVVPQLIHVNTDWIVGRYYLPGNLPPLATRLHSFVSTELGSGLVHALEISSSEHYLVKIIKIKYFASNRRHPLERRALWCGQRRSTTLAVTWSSQNLDSESMKLNLTREDAYTM